MKILIIEDEERPRKGLYKLLNNKYSGIQILPPQSNGIEGLKIINQEQPDIILSDISMPDMDGLEMISKIEQTNYHPYIIILSGYSNFEFAQKALSLGVKEYILKPFKIEDIINKIDTALTEVTTSKMHQKSIILEEINSDNISSYILLIRYKDNYYINEIITKIINYFGKYLGKNILINHEIDKDQQVILFNIQSNDNELENKFPRNDEISHRFDLILKNKVVGFIITNDNLNNKGLFLNDILFAHTFYNIPTISYLSEINNNTNDLSYLSIEKEKELVQAIHKNNQKVIISSMKNFINSKTDQKLSPNSIYLNLKNTLYKNNSYFMNNSTKDINTIFNSLVNCFNIEELINTLSQLFNFNDNIIPTHKTDNSLINQTLNIIEKNIYSPIYLDEVAQQLNISSEHLSRLFKEEINIGFNQYINMKKIKIAKKLLLNDQLKVSDISEQLGFSSPRYFSKVFKKLEGITTKEFKTNNLI